MSEYDRPTHYAAPNNRRYGEFSLVAWCGTKSAIENTPNWDNVTCKRCLAKRDKGRARYEKQMAAQEIRRAKAKAREEKFLAQLARWREEDEGKGK